MEFVLNEKCKLRQIKGLLNDISFNNKPESSRVTERIVSRLGLGKYKFPALPGYP